MLPACARPKLLRMRELELDVGGNDAAVQRLEPQLALPRAAAPAVAQGWLPHSVHLPLRRYEQHVRLLRHRRRLPRRHLRPRRSAEQLADGLFHMLFQSLTVGNAQCVEKRHAEWHWLQYSKCLCHRKSSAKWVSQQRLYEVAERDTSYHT